MRSTTGFAALAALLLAMAASTAGEFVRPATAAADCVKLSSGSSDVSLYPSEYLLVGDEKVDETFYTQVNSARGFNVKYYPTYKVVTNTIANETYVLSQCGVAPPAADSFPAGTKFFTVPLTTLSAPETVPYTFVDMLNLGDRVHDVSQFITSPCGQALLECPNGDRLSPGSGDDYVQLSNATYLGEQLASVTDGVMLTAALDYPESFAVSAAQDPGVLNRAEWIKFVGLFFNKEREASDTFAALKAEYEATKAAAAPKDKAAKKPVVAWAQHTAEMKEWALPEAYVLSFAPFKVQYTEDAGGAMLDQGAIAKIKGVQTDAFSNTTLKFVWDGSEGAFPTQAAAKAAFLDALKSADVIIDETYFADSTKVDSAAMLKEWGLTEAEAAAVPAIANKKVFREDGLVSDNQGTIGLDWFEGAIARPGQVLKDVVRAVQPELASKDQGFVWIRNVFTEKPVVKGAESCGNKLCSGTPATICPFVKVCAEGQAPALLTASTNGQCTYAECGQASALSPTVPSPTVAGTGTTNGAAAVAPALMLALALAAAVQLLF